MVIHLAPLALGYVIGRLVSSDDDDEDHVDFVDPLLVRVNQDTGSFRAGEYVYVTAYVSNTDRETLYGYQRNQGIKSELQAARVSFVGYIQPDGIQQGDWVYYSGLNGNFYYERSRSGYTETILEEPYRNVEGIETSYPESLPPRKHAVEGSKGVVYIATSYQ